MIKNKGLALIFIFVSLGFPLSGCNNEVKQNENFGQIMDDMQDQIVHLMNEDGTDLARDFDNSLLNEMNELFKTIDKDILNEKNRRTFNLLKAKRKSIIEMKNFEERVDELFNDEDEVDQESVNTIKEQLEHFEEQTMYYERLSKKIKKYYSNFE